MKAKLFILGFLLIAWPLQAQAGCFTQHLNEAIQLNGERKELYSALTNGASEKVSSKLIFYEKLSLAPAFIVDWKAKKFQKKGINIVCDAFVSMDLVPSFSPSSPIDPLPLEDYQAANFTKLETKIYSLLEKNHFITIWGLVVAEIDKLWGTETYNCMSKHLLESMARIAWLAPTHYRRAKKKGLDSLNLSSKLIALHLSSIELAVKLDKLAAPIQSQGIPIICQDVPPIFYGIF